VNAPSWSGITPPLWCIYSDTSRLLVAVSGTSINLYPRVSRSAYRIEDFRNEPARGRKAVLLGKRRPGQSRRKLHAARLDVRVGMLFPKLGVCAIIVTTASTPHAYGRHDLNDVADAAKVLEPAVGRGRWAGALSPSPISTRSSSS
jgi:Mn2+/Fe2+ NRAMP family transporter